MVYKCPLCKKEYKRYPWFVKHIDNYTEKEKRQGKIFLNANGNSLNIQGKLDKFLKKE